MRDSNSFHSTCLDTYPPIFYLNETSKRAIAAVHAYNESLAGVGMRGGFFRKRESTYTTEREREGESSASRAGTTAASRCPLSLIKLRHVEREIEKSLGVAYSALRS